MKRNDGFKWSALVFALTLPSIWLAAAAPDRPQRRVKPRRNAAMVAPCAGTATYLTTVQNQNNGGVHGWTFGMRRV